MVAQFVKNELEAAKKPEDSGFFGTASKQSKVNGSGDVTRTHDTPGMNENCHAIRKPRKHAVNWLNA